MGLPYVLNEYTIYVHPLPSLSPQLYVGAGVGPRVSVCHLASVSVSLGTGAPGVATRPASVRHSVTVVSVTEGDVDVARDSGAKPASSVSRPY